MDTTKSQFTAVKRQAGTSKGEPKYVVHVYRDGIEIDQAGGARAGRAEAVLLCRWGSKPLGIYGVRGDYGKAVTEAVKLGSATTMRHGGALLQVTPAAEAIAVQVVSEETFAKMQEVARIDATEAKLTAAGSPTPLLGALMSELVG